MISIIIPTLNEESVIENTLNSLKSSLTIPHEIIVSDGNSTDRTVEIARKIADKVITHDGSFRQTIAAGRNAGAAAASGEFLVFLDADTTIPDINAFFTLILNDFALNPILVAVNVPILVLPEHETYSDWAISHLFNDYLWFVNNVMHIGMGAGEFQMVRNDTFRTLKGYNENLVASEDIELFARLSRVGQVRFNKDLCVYHTGRRAHKIGWPKLLSLWMLNSIYMQFLGRAFVKEWEPIR